MKRVRLVLLFLLTLAIMHSGLTALGADADTNIVDMAGTATAGFGVVKTFVLGVVGFGITLSLLRFFKRK